ncbi:MAG TPA: Gfo/Idh/MocA family oxidoreductase [Ktedonobacterales bacterium]|jgi:predicted dehydrogenase
MAHDPLRWGVLGTGKIGRNAMIPAMLAADNARLVAVASRDLARAEAALAPVADRAPGARALAGYAALLADPEVEAVYITLPNSQHVEWSTRAAQAGKHVLCEKPLALTADDARRVVDACRTSNVLLLEGFMYRFHPQTAWTLEQVAAGRIGPVVTVRGSFAFDIRGRPHDIRLQGALGGGSLLDVGSYPLTYCLAVFAESPRAVAARAQVPPGAEVEHAVAAALDFGAGRLGVIDCGFRGPRHQRVEIVGEDGRIVVEAPFTPGTTDTVVRVVRGDETLEKRFAGVDQYRLQLEHFGHAARSRSPLAIPPEDAVANAAAIEDIYRAAGYTWPPVAHARSDHP